jgi:hypothetical protein
MRYHEHPLLLPAAQGAAELDLNSGLRQALAFCTDSLQQRNGVSGDTPYTGGAGVAFALWRAACLTHDAALLEQARQLAHQALAAIQGGRAGRCVRESLLDGELTRQAGAPAVLACVRCAMHACAAKAAVPCR